MDVSVEQTSYLSLQLTGELDNRPNYPNYILLCTCRLLDLLTTKDGRDILRTNGRLAFQLDSYYVRDVEEIMVDLMSTLTKSCIFDSSINVVNDGVSLYVVFLESGAITIQIQSDDLMAEYQGYLPAEIFNSPRDSCGMEKTDRRADRHDRRHLNQPRLNKQRYRDIRNSKVNFRPYWSEI